LALDSLRSLLDSFLRQERYSRVAGHIGRPAMVEHAPTDRIQVVLTDVGGYKGDSSDLANIFASRVRNSKLNTSRGVPRSPAEITVQNTAIIGKKLKLYR
jgi:hypothetical protein